MMILVVSYCTHMFLKPTINLYRPIIIRVSRFSPNPYPIKTICTLLSVTDNKNLPAILYRLFIRVTGFWCLFPRVYECRR